MIKKFFKDITGITAKEEENARISLSVQELITRELEAAAERKLIASEKRKAAKATKKEEELAKLTPKEIADKRKEAWVDVTGFKVNPEDIKHGFYELDWNSYFIIKLKEEGYGFDGDPDEEIVDRWFREICLNVAAEAGIDMTDRSAGYINVTKLMDGKAEVR